MLITLQESVSLFALRFRISTQILSCTYAPTLAQEGTSAVKSTKLAFQSVTWAITEIRLLLYVLHFAQQRYIHMVRILQELVLDPALIILDMQITIVEYVVRIASILCQSKHILTMLIKLVCRYVQWELGLLTIQLLTILSINVLRDVLLVLLIIFLAGA